MDAVVAVVVADASMGAAALLGKVNAVHTHFPEDPDAAHAALERAVLAALELWHLIPGHGGGGGGGGGGNFNGGSNFNGGGDEGEGGGGGYFGEDGGDDGAASQQF
jgi:uncharacterized membrane protein YgcG